MAQFSTKIQNKGKTMKEWDSGWKSPCILEHLLTDDRKARLILKVFSSLKMKIEVYTDNKWFDIVEQ